MADADAVRGAGVPDLVPAPSPGGPGAAPAPGAVMTLVDHLSELRSRLIKSVATIVGGSVIGFLFAPNIRHLLVAPLPATLPVGHREVVHRTVSLLNCESFGHGQILFTTRSPPSSFDTKRPFDTKLLPIWRFVSKRPSEGRGIVLLFLRLIQNYLPKWRFVAKPRRQHPADGDIPVRRVHVLRRSPQVDEQLAA